MSRTFGVSLSKSSSNHPNEAFLSSLQFHLARLEMTRGAICRGSLRPMAANTKIHVQFLRLDRHRLLSHISVALLAIDSRANMGRMLESNVLRRIEPEHRLPGDVLFFGRISSNFLDLRIVGRNRLMARHTESDAGNSSVRPLSHPRVATSTLHAILKMNTMIKGDWLHRRGLPLEILSCGIDERLSPRSEYGGEICGHRDNRCFD